MPDLDIPTATEEPTPEGKQGEETSGKPRSFWHQFDGKPVLVQLRDGVLYATVNYPNSLRQHPDPEAPPGTMFPTRFIRGVLRMMEDHSSIRLCIETEVDGTLGHPMRMHVLLHPDDTAFVTVAG